MKLHICPDPKLIKFRAESLSVKQTASQRSAASAHQHSSHLLCCQGAAAFKTPLVTQCQNPLSGAAILALVAKVQCYSTISAGQDVKANKRGRLVLKVLSTKNKPIEIKNGVTSSLAVGYDSDFQVWRAHTGAACLAC